MVKRHQVPAERVGCSVVDLEKRANRGRPRSQLLRVLWLSDRLLFTQNSVVRLILRIKETTSVTNDSSLVLEAQRYSRLVKGNEGCPLP